MRAAQGQRSVCRVIQGLKGVVAAIVRAHYIVASCARARRGLALGQHDALTAVITTRMGPHGGAIVPSWWRLARVQERLQGLDGPPRAPRIREWIRTVSQRCRLWSGLCCGTRLVGVDTLASQTCAAEVYGYKLLRRNEDRTSHQKETETARAGDGVRRTTDKAEGSVCRRKVRSGWPCHAIHAFHKTTWNEKHKNVSL